MVKNLVKKYQDRFGIRTTLRGYQLRAANLGVELDSYALLMDPRLGKTRVDVAVAGYRFKQGQILRWVIIGPIISLEVWAQEIRTSMNVPYQMKILEGKVTEKSLILKKWVDHPDKLSIVLINFESTWRIKKFLYRYNPDKVTVDESHRIKNHASKQSRTIHNLGKRATYRAILTGTFMAKPSDCFSQYKFLDPSVFGTVWKDNPRKRQPSFLGRYVEKWGYGGHNPETFRLLDELNEKIHSRAFRLTRLEAGGFPIEHTQDLKFRLTSPATKHYREMEEKLRTMVQGNRVNAEIVLTQILRLQQITGGFLPVLKPDEDLATNVAIGKDRIMALAELVEEYPNDEPLVIFAKFKYEISAILGQLKKMGRSSNFIVGGMKDRTRAISDFQSSRVHTCVAQIRAGGISVDLSRANTAIFYSVTHYLEYEQAKARIIARTGGSVSFLRLAAMDTIDEDLLMSLDSNESVVQRILKNPIYK